MGVLQKGYEEKQEGGKLKNGSEPPKEIKDEVFREHVLGTTVAYDCVENAKSKTDVPILLQ